MNCLNDLNSLNPLCFVAAPILHTFIGESKACAGPTRAWSLESPEPVRLRRVQLLRSEKRLLRADTKESEGIAAEDRFLSFHGKIFPRLNNGHRVRPAAHRVGVRVVRPDNPAILSQPLN